MLETSKNPLLLAALSSANRPICVLGKGITGLAATRLLQANGLQTLLLQPDEVVQNQHEISQIVVLSPGIPKNQPQIAALIASGHVMISEIELALCFMHSKLRLIGVTGTNGKSTVCHALASCLNHMGKPAIACGNIGRALSDVALDSFESETTLVVELSSYQLEHTYTAAFDLAIFTNFSEDHLARYGSMQVYFAAKWRITGLVKEFGHMICTPGPLDWAQKLGYTIPGTLEISLVKEHGEPPNREGMTLHPLLKVYKPQTLDRLPPIVYAGESPDSWCASVKQEVEYQLSAPDSGTFCFRTPAEPPESQIVLRQSSLKGRHNFENLGIVFATLPLLSEDPQRALQFFQASPPGESYRGLPHRLEVVMEHPVTGVTVINDSKSTSMSCTAEALKIFPQTVFLLLGGALKAKSLEALLPALRGRRNVRIWTFGPDSGWLADELRANQCQVQAFEQLDAAVQAAVKALQGNEVLLLSPGAASFDAFHNFEERGEHFKMMVKRLMPVS